VYSDMIGSLLCKPALLQHPAGHNVCPCLTPVVWWSNGRSPTHFKDMMPTQATPLTAEQFFEQSGYRKLLERQTFEQTICNALDRAGFTRSRMQQMRPHRLTVVTGRCLAENDFRLARRIRSDLRRAFREEGLRTTSSMITVYRAGSWLLAQVGVLESKV